MIQMMVRQHDALTVLCLMCRYDAIRVGEPAEVIVLSRTGTFESFKVRLQPIGNQQHARLPL